MFVDQHRRETEDWLTKHRLYIEGASRTLQETATSAQCLCAELHERKEGE